MELHFSGEEKVNKGGVGAGVLSLIKGWWQLFWDLIQFFLENPHQIFRFFSKISQNPISQVTPSPHPSHSLSLAERNFFAKHEAKNGIFLSLPRRHWANRQTRKKWLKLHFFDGLCLYLSLSLSCSLTHGSQFTLNVSSVVFEIKNVFDWGFFCESGEAI